MATPEKSSDDERYLILTAALLDIQEGGMVPMIAEHNPEVGDLLTRATVSPEHIVTLSPKSDADEGSPDATPREIGYDELADILHPAIAIWRAHYKPNH